MGIQWDGMGRDRHKLPWDGMGWNRKICPLTSLAIHNYMQKGKKHNYMTIKKLGLIMVDSHGKSFDVKYRKGPYYIVTVALHICLTLR